MKIIINTTNLYVGGGVQVALSFLNELNNSKSSNTYYVFLSSALEEQLDLKLFSDFFKFYTFSISPARLLTRKSIVSEMNALENKINPDVVFSVFGPTYWRPKNKHIMGFALPWLLNKSSAAYGKLSYFANLKMKVKNYYIEYYTKRDADFYVIETNDGKKRLSSTLCIDSDLIYVVGNCYSAAFDNLQLLEKGNSNYIELPLKEKDEFRLLIITHPYPHKNLDIITSIIPLLNMRNIKFVLTVDDAVYEDVFSRSENIINLGRITQNSCPSVYSQCDALFQPSLLEVFSASYPEAMKMRLPILASDMDFARDVCENAALYFDALNPLDACNKIEKLAISDSLKEDLITLGDNRLIEFETAKSRAEKYLLICDAITKLEI